MNKKKIMAGLLVVLAVLLDLYIFAAVKPDPSTASAKLGFAFCSDKNMELQVFYKEDTDFSEEASVMVPYAAAGSAVELKADVSAATRFLRLDFGGEANHAVISDAYYEVNGTHLPLNAERFAAPLMSNLVENIRQEGNGISLDAQDVDPWILISTEDVNLTEVYLGSVQSRFLWYRIALCAVLDAVLLLCIAQMETLFRVPFEIYKDRIMFRDLVRNDFQARFAGSYFGIFWAYIQPVITMVLYWFVFQIGLRAGSVSDYPFILYLMSGLITWFYFSEAWASATSSLFEYSYLVKKVVFNVGILPVIKVASALFVHLFFVAFVAVLCMLYGYGPDLYLLQLLYYIPCTAFLVVGISYITASFAAFFKDITQIVNIALTVGIWVTPIMWNPVVTMSPRAQTILKANPVYYIVDGFRDALLAKHWVWEKPVWNVYFWVLSITIYLVGVKLFNRLKVHFSDVL